MIFHIDMSNHYHQGSYSVLAIVSVNTSNKSDHNHKKGVVIEEPLRSKIVAKYGETMLHAGLIYFLIKDLSVIKSVVICADVNPLGKVMSYLNILYPGMFGRLKSLREIRELVGQPKLKSASDAFARNIKKNYFKRLNIKRRKNYFDDGSVISISDTEKFNRDELFRILEKINR